MKKALSLILALVMCLSVCACSGEESTTNTESSAITTAAPTDYRLTLTAEEIYERIESVVEWQLESYIERVYGSYCDSSSTRYSIGSLDQSEYSSEDDPFHYEVSGKVYLYDKYGNYKADGNFSFSHIHISDSGSAVSLGGLDVDVDF